MSIVIKSQREIEIMRESCILAAKTLNYLNEEIKIGITTEDVNTLVHEYTLAHNAIPATLNYQGFPKSCCTSLNEVICHGIPSKKEKIREGDILNVDVTSILKGFHGDTNRTYLIGEVRPEIKNMVEFTYDALMASIAICKPGVRLGDIGALIEEMANDHGYGVVHEYCGHGIGRDFHEEPQVLHYGKKGTGVELVPGMTFTIEPMINLGSRHCKTLRDGWTVVTKDKKPSAQFEHTIRITEDGHEILTLDPDFADQYIPIPTITKHL